MLLFGGFATAFGLEYRGNEYRGQNNIKLSYSAIRTFYPVEDYDKVDVKNIAQKFLAMFVTCGGCIF